jgi:glycosyltransferase involved in cell wall biosynthesis
MDLQGLGIAQTRIRQIPPGVDTSFFSPGEKTEYPSIIYFGGFRDYKRPWEILYGIKTLLKIIPDVRVTMVGSGPSLEKTVKISRDNDLDGYVNFTGRLSHEELRDRISESWLNVHTSITEGFGYSVLEACAAGTPTVAYNVPGIRDVIVHGKNGMLVPDGDRNALADAILSIIQSYSDSWIGSARSVALNYSWDRTADLWENHLKTISSS